MADESAFKIQLQIEGECPACDFNRNQTFTHKVSLCSKAAPVQPPPVLYLVVLLQKCLIASLLIIHGFWQIKSHASPISRRRGSVQFQRNYAFPAVPARDGAVAKFHRTRWEILFHLQYMNTQNTPRELPGISCNKYLLHHPSFSLESPSPGFPTKTFQPRSKKMTPFHYQDDKKWGSIKYVTLRGFQFMCQ